MQTVGLLKKPDGWKDQEYKLLSEGVTLCKQQQIVEGVRSLILGSALEEACTYASEFLKEQFGKKGDFWQCLEVVELLQSCNISKV